MKYRLLFFLLFIISSAVAQHQSSAPFIPYHTVLVSRHSASLFHRSWWPHFVSPDKQVTYRPKSLLPMTMLGSTSFKGENYWMGYITTQSYNQGKLGTYYMWDVQGNLRESRMFLDIAGKNKRGLKLVFRRR